MHALKAACSSAILILEALGIALLGAIAYRNVSLDEWEDSMNLAPLSSGARPLPKPHRPAVKAVRMRSGRSLRLPQ